MHMEEAYKGAHILPGLCFYLSSFCRKMVAVTILVVYHTGGLVQHLNWKFETQCDISSMLLFT